jgi:hypothetical protein
MQAPIVKTAKYFPRDLDTVTRDQLREIITALGGPATVADALAVDQTAVYRWQRATSAARRDLRALRDLAREIDEANGL